MVLKLAEELIDYAIYTSSLKFTLLHIDLFPKKSIMTIMKVNGIPLGLFWQ